MNKKLDAFTLTELLVALIILGILILIALPKLMPLISNAKSTEAKLQLDHVYTLQKNYFYMYSRYSKDLSAIDFEQEKLVSEGGRANYVIEITEASNNTFIAKASSITDFDGDGVLNVWEINQDKELKEVIKD